MALRTSKRPPGFLVWLVLLVLTTIVGCHAGLRTTFSGNRLPDIIPGQPGIDYPAVSRVPTNLRFRCDQQTYPGFYADPETGCQVFHVCRDNKQTSLICPNGTLYHQRFFVCDWWFNVDCSKSANFYILNKDALQRQQPQDRQIQAQGVALRTTTLQQPTPTPSFAKFDRRADPTFNEWASRHIPLTNPADSSNYKSIRSSEVASQRDVTIPFLDSPLRGTTGSQRGPKLRQIPTPIPRPNFLQTRDKEEFPGPSLAGKIPADKWFLLAKDPDFLNNIAWGAQLHINNKTGGSGYLRPKTANRRPVEQELDFHPFQGFGGGKNRERQRIQEPMRMERARTSFKPSPLLSVTKDQDTFWPPVSTASPIRPQQPIVTSPRPPPPPPPQTRQQPPPPQTRQQPPPPPPPQPHTYPMKSNYGSSKPFKPFALSQVTKPWTQPKKQMYQSTAGGLAYQVILTSASDYEVLLTRAPPSPTSPTLAVSSPVSLPSQPISSSASSPASSRARPQLQPPKLISPSNLPLEPHPLTNQGNRNFQKAASSVSPNVVNNQQRLATQQSTTTVQPPEQVKQQQQQKLFRSPEAEKITSQSVPMRPSVLLSSNLAVSTQSPFEFEPTEQKWVSSRATESDAKVSSSSSTNTLRQTPRYVETDIIRGKSTTTDPLQDDSEHFRSFVVRPRNPTRVSDV